MILNSLFPVFAMILIGALLKHLHLTNETFLKTSDKLVYFIFFPAMLFWKIGGTSSGSSIDWNFFIAAVCSVFLIYFLGGIYIKVFNVTDFKAGSFSQSCYRFNTYIGMAVIINALGESGIRHFGVLIGFIIPIINVLAVSTLIWFSGKSYTFRSRIAITARALITNPLIVACIAGIIYSRYINRFPLFLDNTFRLTSMVTLPLALLSIGGTLTFQTLKTHLKLSIAGSIFKLFVFPCIGYFFMRKLSVTGISFQVGMIFFTLPTATSIYVLSSQLHSDTELASATIMLSTILSFFSLSMVMTFI